MPGIIKKPGATNTTKDSQKELSIDDGRKLTSGEIELCKKLFGNAIDYRFVRIHKSKLIPGVQSGQVSMTPWGELYMPDDNYLDDFSMATGKKINYLHHFIHEMAHVWQYQRKNKLTRGSIVICGGALSINTGIANTIESIGNSLPNSAGEILKDISGEIDPYTYKGSLLKNFFQYNMESQAEMLADYFVSEIMGIAGYIGKNSNRRIRAQFFYQDTLEPFFEEVDQSNRRPRDLKIQWKLK